MQTITIGDNTIEYTHETGFIVTHPLTVRKRTDPIYCKHFLPPRLHVSKEGKFRDMSKEPDEKELEDVLSKYILTGLPCKQ